MFLQICFYSIESLCCIYIYSIKVYCEIRNETNFICFHLIFNLSILPIQILIYFIFDTGYLHLPFLMNNPMHYLFLSIG